MKIVNLLVLVLLLFLIALIVLMQVVTSNTKHVDDFRSATAGAISLNSITGHVDIERKPCALYVAQNRSCLVQ